MIDITLKVKPMSVNGAWRSGPRYRSKEYLAYERELSLLLPKKKISGEVEIHYTFYIKNYSRTDVDNLIKVTQDILVKNGIIDDDRNIVYLSAHKIKSKEEKIEIEIRKYEQDNT